jgi:hypothetical protein
VLGLAGMSAAEIEAALIHAGGHLRAALGLADARRGARHDDRSQR